jgi:Rrf2 family protein
VLLSRTSAYAVRAAVHLAQQGGDMPTRVDDVAEALDVPRNYLSKILHQLARAGVLISERGPRGGFRLAARPEEISLAEIVEAVVSQPVNRRCLLGRPECSDARPCPMHERWQPVADDITAFLRDTTLATVRRRSVPVRRRKTRTRRRASAGRR